MSLIRQVLSDLLGELNWVVVYGFVSAMVMMALILISLSYQDVSATDKAMARFESADITICSVQPIPQNVSVAQHDNNTGNSSNETLDQYFSDVFVRGGHGGTYISLPGRLGYQQVYILLGIYAELTPYGLIADTDPVFAVSADLNEHRSDNITLGGDTYPLNTAPAEMDLYHPLYYMGADDPLLQQSLFIFTYDYQTVQRLFPPSEYEELSPDIMMDRFILSGQDDEDIIRLRRVILEQMGAYIGTSTFEEQVMMSSESGVRTHQFYIFFYLGSTFILLGTMLLNLYNILRRKTTDYMTHHLFGATRIWIFGRMLGFALIYQMIPWMSTIYILRINQSTTPFMITTILLGGLIIGVGIVSLVFHSIMRQFSQGFRSE
ncbi:hypothetical protein HCH52_12095 [Oscillospiraceae bacterium HV4-5-C5C]|nr:hypothetical protein [Oscillospiraceae bacterium HV4-5-C5C]